MRNRLKIVNILIVNSTRLFLACSLVLVSSVVHVVQAKDSSSQIKINDKLISVSFAPSPYKQLINQASLLKWIETRANAVADYYQGFPVNKLDIIVNTSKGKRVNGTTYAGQKPLIVLSLGDELTLEKLQSDWVLVHELVHLAFPSVRKKHHWMEEGLATYVEPIVRVQAGLMTERQAWYWILTGVPKGQPASGDRGLDFTPTWGRTYWGGALFCLLVDYKIRQETSNKYNIGDALRAITKAGGTMQDENLWSISDALKVGDKATKTTVLMSTYQAMKDKPMKVDLQTMWKNLGVSLVNNKVVFDEAAPQSALRRALFSKS